MRVVLLFLIAVVVLPLSFVPVQADSPFSRANSGNSRGYLTTPAELEQIRTLATTGVEPYRSNVEDLIKAAGYPTDWQYGNISGEIVTSQSDCYSRRGYDMRYLLYNGGAQDVYRKVLSYYMTQDLDYAREAREKILGLTETYGFGGNLFAGGNQCIIMLGFSIPTWIAAADLLGSTPVWSRFDKMRFQNWLSYEVYPKVAWASRTRSNNWGSAGSLTAAMIADYVSDRATPLRETAPFRISLSPEQAFQQHNMMQYFRMTGLLRGDSQCRATGIQAYGGIPDELRRGSTGCDGRWIEAADRSLTYHTIQVEHLVFHAEFLLRRGNDMLYRNGAIARAIKFVVDNPFGHSTDWVSHSKGTLFVAYQYYCDAVIGEAAATLDTFKGGDTLVYAPLTHPLNRCRNSVPVTEAP